MTTLPQQQTIIQYVTSNSQTQYTFAFYAPLPTDIQVYYQASNATPIPASDILSLNSQYTVTYNSDPTTGGYITLLFTPTSGYYLTIVRAVQATLTTNFAVAQNFNGANLDAALDRLLLLIQQNQNYALERNLSYVINTYLPNTQPYTQLPPLPQNYVWMGSSNGVVAAQIATIPSASALQSMLANNAPSTDGATLVGYYNASTSTPTTVDAQLTSLLTIGTFVSSNVPQGSAVSLMTNVNSNITSISLPPGDWDVWAQAVSLPASGTTYQSFLAGINTTSATLPTISPTGGSMAGANNIPSNPTQGLFLSVPPIRLNLSVTTTVYLVVTSVFSVSTMAAYGFIAARLASVA